ncbi:TraB/GumN family protein [Vibrio metoecus]|uniref:TraB/GumN family protein n=1 Tax=Vibrio metoecus TaxID=1481663 RepID=UPI0006D7BDFF|nr:TraB/GumN family protein [Vibrio metoecus]KQA18295.1 polysaccharide biosynthesis protein GumN [Vibrio metoecus]
MRNRFAFCLLWLFIPPLHAEPLYWSATKGSTQLILFGSLHVGSDQLYPLPNPLTQELKQSAGLVVETDIRHQSNVTLPTTKVSSEQVLSDEQLFVLDGIAQQLRLDAQQIRQLPPWSASLILQMHQFLEMGYQAERGIDLYFMHQAEQDQLPVISLETLQFQVDLLAHLPNSGKELLVSLLDEWENNTKLTACMIESWKRGDEKSLLQMLTLTGMSVELEAQMLTERNKDWAEKLTQPHFLPQQGKPYVVVVGTLHLIGKQSLLSFLEQKGFSIKQLNQSQTATCSFL